MEKTSLDQFKWMIDTQYPQVKKYIVSENENRIVIEDPMGDSVFGSNKELSPLYEWPTKFPFKKITTSYSEKSCSFTVKIDLK